MATEDHGEFDLTGELLDGRYRVEKKLDEGGMGAVFLARDESLNGRRVVVKVPHPGFLVQANFAQRFDQEIDSLIGAHHPYIVNVFSKGRVKGVPYMVLQYLPGGSLKDRLGRPEAPAEVAQWLPGIGEALDYIHGKQVIHRDVKPGNILFDESGHAILADFGIAKALSIRDLHLTKSGASLGSPHYMAPEISRPRTITGRYDQYSLAVVVYEALSGKFPHDGETDHELVLEKNEKEPRPLHDFVRTIPPLVEACVMKALTKAPDDRFATCSEFAEAFRAAVAGQRHTALDRPMTSPAPSDGARRHATLTGVETRQIEPNHAPDAEAAAAEKAARASVPALPPTQRHTALDRARRAPTNASADAAPVANAPQRRNDETVTGVTTRLVATNNATDEEAAVAGKAARASVSALPPTRRRTGVLVGVLLIVACALGVVMKQWSGRDSGHAPVEHPAHPPDASGPTPDTHAAAPPMDTPGAAGASSVQRVAKWADVMRDEPDPKEIPDGGVRQRIQATGLPWLVKDMTSGMELVLVPPGEFQMGGNDIINPDEEPVHTVKITQPFYAGRYPVTQGEYERVTGNNPSNFKGDSRLPVEQVSYYDLLDENGKPKMGGFLDKTGLRLLTEAEWEYVARGLHPTTYPWGDSIDSTFANYDASPEHGTYLGKTTLVGSYPKGISWCGAYDMVGNVLQWCFDYYDKGWYAEYVRQGSPPDPTGPTSGSSRVFRGGSWYYNAIFVRCAVRLRGDPARRYHIVGLRCARTP